MFSNHPFLAAAAENTSSVKDIFSQGGLVLIVLLALSIFLVALVALLFMTLREQVLIPSNFMNEAADLTEKGDMEAFMNSAKNLKVQLVQS